jgi:phosphopantetheinyl transferase
MDVWIMQIPNDFEKFLVLRSELSPTEMVRMSSFKRDLDQFTYLMGHLMAKKACITCTDIKNPEMRWTDYGRPYFKDAPFDFNISHHGEWVALGFSRNAQVGIDITVKEKVSDWNAFLAPFMDYLHETEVKWIESGLDRMERFMITWALKESILKMLGLGILVDMKRYVFFIDKVNANYQIACHVDNAKLNGVIFKLEKLDSSHFMAIAYGANGTVKLESKKPQDLLLLN